jgi:uncharacterized membrane protein
MLDELRLLLAPHYAWIKALHVLAAMIWAGSTAVAYAFYLKPAFRRVQHRPGDAAARAERNRLMERFDRGVALEHLAFPVLVVTALAMLWLGSFELGRVSYLTVKLWLGVLVFLPMEIVDIYLSHLGGHKATIRASGDTARYERFMDLHWLFFRITEPIIVIVVPIVVLLAVAKPF